MEIILKCNSKNYTRKHICMLVIVSCFISSIGLCQTYNKTMQRLPDTGQNNSYTSTFGEDNDFLIYSPYFLLNGNGTVTDTITGLMWQQADGGEMTIENAIQYCSNLNLGGFNDWRLPNAHEAFSILNHQNTNPSLNTSVFTTTTAEYWWTSDFQLNDNTKVWATNAGGGIGNHPKTETISAGGIKRFHVRAVRSVSSSTLLTNHFTDNGNGTITDNSTKLIWQKNPYADTLTWEQALNYANTLTVSGMSDWRLPNIKEIQSINDELLSNPSINPSYFGFTTAKKIWSSTTLPNQTSKAWYLDSQFGITTHANKTNKINVICVRGSQLTSIGIIENKTIRKEISAYPNPFNSKINLKGLNVNNTTVELYDCFSRMLYFGNNISEQDFSDLPKGIYFLKDINFSFPPIKLVKE